MSIIVAILLSLFIPERIVTCEGQIFVCASVDYGEGIKVVTYYSDKVTQRDYEAFTKRLDARYGNSAPLSIGKYFVVAYRKDGEWLEVKYIKRRIRVKSFSIKP